MKTEFKIISGDRIWELTPFMSAHGLRKMGYPIHKIKVQIVEEFDLRQFDDFIKYLCHLRDEMAYQ